MIGSTNKQQQNMAKEEIIIDGEEGTGRVGWANQAKMYEKLLEKPSAFKLNLESNKKKEGREEEKELKYRYPAWVDNASLRRHRLLNENSLPAVGYLSLSYWSGRPRGL